MATDTANPTTTEQPTQIKSSATKAWQGSILSWLFWRVPAAMEWYWLCGVILSALAGRDILPFSSWGALGFLLLLVVFSVRLVQQGIGPAFALLGYHAVFPLVVLILVLRPGFKLTRIVCISARNLLSLRGTALTTTSLLILLLYLSIAPPTVFTQLTASAAIILEMLVMASALAWAHDPLHPFVSLVGFIANAIVADKQWSLDSTVPKTSQGQKLLERMKLMGSFRSYSQNVRHFVSNAAPRMTVLMYAGAAATLFLFLCISHGIILSAFQNAAEPPFQNLSSSVIECIIYATTLLTTSPLPDVIPVGQFGRLVYATGPAITFLLVTMFIQMFAVAIGMQATDRSKAVLAHCDVFDTWLESHCQELKELSVDILHHVQRDEVKVDHTS